MIILLHFFLFGSLCVVLGCFLLTGLPSRAQNFPYVQSAKRVPVDLNSYGSLRSPKNRQEIFGRRDSRLEEHITYHDGIFHEKYIRHRMMAAGRDAFTLRWETRKEHLAYTLSKNNFYIVQYYRKKTYLNSKYHTMHTCFIHSFSH